MPPRSEWQEVLMEYKGINNCGTSSHCWIYDF